MLLMVELFHYFSFKVCLLGLLVNMYIFKLSKTYNKILFEVLLYNITLSFESFVKYFHEQIPVAALFFLFLSLSLGAYYEVMEMNSGKPKEVFVHNRIIHKNLSQFCNSYYHLRDSNSYLWPIFQGLNYLIVSYFSHKFPARISIISRGIFKKQRYFFVHSGLI